MPEVHRWPKKWWNESNRVHIGLSFNRPLGRCASRVGACGLLRKREPPPCRRWAVRRGETVGHLGLRCRHVQVDEHLGRRRQICGRPRESLRPLRMIMIWYHLSMQPKWIENVYGDTPPTLRAMQAVHGPAFDQQQRHDLDAAHQAACPRSTDGQSEWDEGACNRVAIELSLWESARCTHRRLEREQRGGRRVPPRRRRMQKSIVLTALGTWGRITAMCRRALHQRTSRGIEPRRAMKAHEPRS